MNLESRYSFTRQALALVVLVAASVLGSGCAHGSGGAPGAGELDELVNGVKPSVVRILVVEPSYSRGKESKFVATGSGAIITPDGHVVTNHHVAGNAVRIVCTMADREEIPARLVGTDAATDIAVIKLEPADGRTFPVLDWGDSSQVRVGDPVLAVGSPLGLSQSVTQGVISNTAMVIPSLSAASFLTLDGEQVGELVRWFAHDAAIYGGNSGGPLINTRGQIVGVNELSYGLAGAIPGNLARKVAEDLIAHGTVRRAYIGATFQPLLKSLGDESGALVSSVYPDSPASRAGLEPGDILLSVDAVPTIARHLEDLPVLNNQIADLPLDRAVTFVVLRDGNEQAMEVTAEERQPARPPQVEVPAWGMTARDLTLWTTLSTGRDSAEGVLVTSRRDGGPIDSAMPDLMPRDIIKEIDGEPVRNVAELVGKTKALFDGRNESEKVPVLVAFERAAQSYLTVVEIGLDDLGDPGAEVAKAWLPMETQVLTRKLARQLGMEDVRGVRVTRLYNDRPEDFPFQVGDILTHMDDMPIEAAEMHDSDVFETMVRDYRIGLDAEFRILRAGESMMVSALLVESPKRPREMRRFQDRKFDFIAREATYRDREDPLLRGAEVNVLAETVTSGGWASLAGLSSGDALLSVHGRAVRGLDDLESVMDMIHDQEPGTVVFKVRRGPQIVFVEIEPTW